MDDFCTSRSLLRELNHTFIALIPKEKLANELKDYRPISLCNNIYKLISKILVVRLRALMGNLVSPNQATFIGGRRITDNILLAHELVRGFQVKRSPKRAYLKLDLRKAFDSVN